MAKAGNENKPAAVSSATAIYDDDGRILSAPIPAEWRDVAAAATAAHQRIDRYQAICDGQVPPPWMKRDTTKRKEGPQERLLTLIFRECWPPNGQVPATETNLVIVKNAGDAFQTRHGRTVDRKTILRKAGRLSR
jgi:hypothetical protein